MFGRFLERMSDNEKLDDTVIITNLRELCEFCKEWLTFISWSLRGRKK